MNVLLVSDGRLFEEDEDDSKVTYAPGDIAWFDEDILLVTSIKEGVAQAIEHPAARQMLQTALDHPEGWARGFAEAMRIHARTMARGWLFALEVGLIGKGRVGDDMHVFDMGDEHVVAVDENDAKAVMREHYRWKAEDDAEHFDDRDITQLDDDETHALAIEPVDKTAAEWAASHGRGWLSGCQ